MKTATLAAVHPNDGRVWHYRDFYRPAGSPRPADRPLWLVWGNCQADALRCVLDAATDRPYRTARVPPVHELDDADLPYLDALLAQTALLVTQPVRTGYRGLPIGVADLIDRLPRGAKVLRWPVIRYAGLFPFQAIARHPADRSITPPAVPYHDLRTVAAARDGRTACDPWDADISVEQIRAVADASVDELRGRERRDSDVAISDVLGRHGADAAHTINHPGNPVLHDLANRLLDASGTAATVTAIVEPLLESVRAPLEQRVIDALGLTAEPRPRWRHNGLDLEPDEVHAIQLAWYRCHPDFVELAVRRHFATMHTLGLLGAAA